MNQYTIPQGYHNGSGAVPKDRAVAHKGCPRTGYSVTRQLAYRQQKVHHSALSVVALQ